ncbi:MAG: ferric reductase-like transmembrane domain-containing protein [Burkholderiales bacterium]|nr:ferric reductase-like transmembrane domain-containing protein [Burkholderiales bacterium]
MTTNTVLAGFLAIVTLAWAWDPASSTLPAASLPWLLRQQALYLSGLYAIALMSLAMVLATRPVWLERPLGGMDRLYRLHKWAGILAVAFAAAHWLIEMSDDVLKALVGREGRLPKERYAGLLEVLRDLGEDMGEWAIYAILAMLAITLWKRFPYGIWRYLHRAMPVLYLMVAFHAAMLAPAGYWSQPVGLLLALLLAAGSVSAALSLAGWIGRHRSVEGTVLAVTSRAPDITEVVCALAHGWKGHRAGQFAFITFDATEGAHPFTIASADRGDGKLTFEIKALGNYTRGLAQRLRAGQRVQVQGPYGRFLLARRDRRAQQVWIAGGIGITPFIAWLESLQPHPQEAPAVDLHYCTRDRLTDPFVAKLEALCAGLPRVRLHVHGSVQGETLTSESLASIAAGTKRTEIWFCGPRGLAQAIRRGLERSRRGRLRFHQEAFELR